MVVGVINEFTKNMNKGYVWKSWGHTAPRPAWDSKKTQMNKIFWVGVKV